MGLVQNRAFVIRSRRDPQWWAREVLGVELWDGQIDVLNSIRDHKKTAVKACHAPGKTFVGAVAVLWFLTSFYGSIVLTTAPTWNQVENLLWREIKSLHARSRVDLGGEFIKKPPQLEMPGHPKWFAQGLSPTEPERFQGYHAPHILILVDEASGVTPAIMGAIEGILMSGINVRLLLLSNPTRPEGTLYDAFHKYRKAYKTFTFDAFDTPNLRALKDEFFSLPTKDEKLKLLRAAPVVNKYLVNASAVADLLDQYGEDSQIWKVRVRAQFPDAANDALIPLWQLEDAVRRWNEMPPELRWWDRLPRHTAPIIGAMDPARYGDNRTSICAHSEYIWAPFRSYEKTSNPAAAARAVEYYNRYRCREMRVDEHGGGGGPLDYLYLNPRINAIGVHVGTPSTNKIYFNLRAEAYFTLQELVAKGLAYIPDDERLIGQLSTIKFKHRTCGKLLIESKEDMVGRGVVSPDEADAMMLSVCPVSSNVVARSVGRSINFEGMYG
jgi:hypothetical protein